MTTYENLIHEIQYRTLDSTGLSYKFTQDQIKRAINSAIRNAYPAWFSEEEDFIVCCEDIVDYDLPSMNRLIRVDIEQNANYFTSVATLGGEFTLVDSTMNWDINEHSGSILTIYSGSGMGEWRQITSNTSDTLMFSVAMTDTPDSTTRYMVKDYDYRMFNYHPITSFSTDRADKPRKLVLHSHQYSPGMFIKVVYIIQPDTLSDLDDETYVPIEWIVHESIANLYLMRQQDAPGFEGDSISNLAAIHKGLADKYKVEHQLHFPIFKVRTFGAGRASRDPKKYPLG